VITSGQVNQMMMQQQQQHQMMTTQAGMMPHRAAPGMSSYPPQFSFGMAHNANQRASSRGFDGMMGAAGGVVGAAGTASGVIGLGTMAAGMAGIAVPGALAAAGALPTMIGLGAGGAMIGGMAQGGRQLGQVNQMFGNMAFANPQARYGRGMSTGDMRTMYGAIRSIEANDPFVGMKDAMQVANKFTEMGMHQGVQDAEKLAGKVKDLGKTLAKMARTMGTSIEEATQAFGQMRQAGFYTAQDVMGNTSQMNIMRGHGMTSGQFGSMQAGGAAMARGMGHSGRTGARFTGNMAQDLMGAVSAGALTGEQLMDITGAGTATEAASAFSQRTMGNMSNFMMNQGAGQAMLAGLGEMRDGKFTGGINQATLRKIQSGELDLNSIQERGRQAMSTRGGASSFMQMREDISESVLGNSEGTSSIVNIVRNTLKENAGYDDSDREILLRQLTGADRRQARVLTQLAERHMEIRRRRQGDMRREQAAAGFGTEMRENYTIGGQLQQIKGSMSETFVRPFQQAGADMKTAFTQGVEGFFDRALGVERLSASSGMLGRNTNDLTLASMASGGAGGIGEKGSAQRRRLMEMGIGSEQLAAFQGASTHRTGGDMAGNYARMGKMDLMQRSLAHGNGGARDLSVTAQGQVADLAAQLHLADEGKRESILGKMRDVVKGEAGDMSDDEADATIAAVGEGSARAVARIRGRSEEGGGLGRSMLGIFAASHGLDTRSGPASDVRRQLRELGDATRPAGADINWNTVGASAIAGATVVGGVGAGIGGAIAVGTAGVGTPVGIGTTLVGAGIGLVGGAIIGGAGVAAAVIKSGLAEGEHSQMMKELEGGTGVELMAKLNTSENMALFDQIYKKHAETTRNEEDRNKAVAAELSQRLGINVKPADVKMAERMFTAKAGRGAQTRTSADRRETVSLAGQVAGLQAELTTQASVEQFQSFAALSRMGSGIDIQAGGDLDKALTTLAANDGLSGIEAHGLIGDAVAAAAEAGMSTSNLASNATDSTRLLAQGAEQYRELQGLAGDDDGLTLDELAAKTGKSKEAIREELAAVGITVSGERISDTETERVIRGYSAGGVAGIASEGAAGITAFLDEGKSDIERQTESVRKLAGMVDAMAAHLTNTQPLTEEARAYLDGRGNLTTPDGDRR